MISGPAKCQIRQVSDVRAKFQESSDVTSPANPTRKESVFF